MGRIGAAHAASDAAAAHHTGKASGAVAINVRRAVRSKGSLGVGKESDGRDAKRAQP